MTHIPIGFSRSSAAGSGFAPPHPRQSRYASPLLQQQEAQIAGDQALAELAQETTFGGLDRVGGIFGNIFGGGGGEAGGGGFGGGGLNPLGSSLSSSLGISPFPTAEFGGLRDAALAAQPAGGVALPGATGVPGDAGQGQLNQLTQQHAEQARLGQGGFGLASTEQMGLGERLQNDALRGANVASQGILTRQRGQGIRGQTGNQVAGLGLAKNLFQRLA